jgi:hypothetical protein
MAAMRRRRETASGRTRRIRLRIPMMSGCWSSRQVLRSFPRRGERTPWLEEETSDFDPSLPFNAPFYCEAVL